MSTLKKFQDTYHKSIPGSFSHHIGGSVEGFLQHVVDTVEYKIGGNYGGVEFPEDLRFKDTAESDFVIVGLVSTPEGLQFLTYSEFDWGDGKKKFSTIPLSSMEGIHSIHALETALNSLTLKLLLPEEVTLRLSL